MSQLLADLQRVKKIWKCVEAIDDKGLEEERNAVSRKYDAVVKNLNNAIERETSSEPRTPKDVAVTVVDVMDFVSGAYAFYGKIRSYRQFTAKEKQVHGEITSLLTDADVSLACSVNSGASSLPATAAEILR